MKCKNCGKELSDGVYCPYCGTKNEGLKESNVKDKYRMGIKKKRPIFLSIPMIILVFFMTCGTGSFIMSIIRYKKYPEKKKSSIVCLAASVIFVLICAVFMQPSKENSSHSDEERQIVENVEKVKGNDTVEKQPQISKIEEATVTSSEQNEEQPETKEQSEIEKTIKLESIQSNCKIYAELIPMSDGSIKLYGEGYDDIRVNSKPAFVIETILIPDPNVEEEGMYGKYYIEKDGKYNIFGEVNLETPFAMFSSSDPIVDDFWFSGEFCAKDENAVNLISNGNDGISPDYASYSFQMDCNEIIDEFHQKGYESVYLESHTVGIGDENKKIGDPGTTDTVYLTATHVEENYFTITEHYGVAYIYWGEGLRWTNSITERVEKPEFDFSGFNGTYWKLNKESLNKSQGADHSSLLREYNSILYGIEFDMTEFDDSVAYEQTEVYICLNDFSTFESTDGSKFTSLEPIGTIIVSGNGKIATGILYCIDYVSSGEMHVSYSESLQSWTMSLNMAILSDKYADIPRIDRWDKLSRTFFLSWCPIEGEGELIPISKEEFEQVNPE